MTIRLGPQVCGTLEEAAAREWLVADGAGGYAMGTVAGLRTRRYHGLLVVAVDGPAHRMLGLAALDPTLVLGDTRVRLATDEWGGGTVDPRGHELLASFDLTDGIPRWRWQIGGVVLERELAAAHGSPTIGVVHRLLACDRPAVLELTPLCTWRDVHGERHANGDPELESSENGFAFEQAYRVAGAGWQAGGEWYRDVRAREEAARGLSDREDLWAAGTFRAELAPGACHEVTAAALPLAGTVPAAADIVAAARKRARNLIRAAGVKNELDAQLVLAADQFAITTGGRPTAVAGYPWFGEWSRDLMTSYEGLYLATNRHDEGREVLRTSAATVSEGMLANTADTGSLEYNTVDGTLWFVHAVGRHVEVTGDDDLGTELAPVLGQIVEHHVEGTRFGIGVDPADGLLRQGADGWALTWMDARIDGVPVTPRAGKPVEVNALWLRALDVAAQLTDDDDVRSSCTSLRERAASSFVARFVRPGGERPLRRRRRPRRGRCDSAPQPAARGGPAERAARPRDGAPRRRRVQPLAPDAARAPFARPRRFPLPPLPPRRPGRARRGLPPGHGLAVAARAVRRRRPQRGRPARRRSRRDRGPSRGLGARLGVRDRRRRRAARRDRLPLPGLVGRRGAARPSRAAPLRPRARDDRRRRRARQVGHGRFVRTG